MNKDLSPNTSNHFELKEKDKQIAQMQKQIDEKNEQLGEYRDRVKSMKSSLNLTEISSVLKEYLERRPERGEMTVHCGKKSIQMKQMPIEIDNGTKIGLDYRNAILKMSIEQFSEENESV